MIGSRRGRFDNVGGLGRRMEVEMADQIKMVRRWEMEVADRIEMVRRWVNLNR